MADGDEQVDELDQERVHLATVRDAPEDSLARSRQLEGRR
jgi:hypothetical protein